MKIKTFKSKQILALYLLKSKTYEQTIKKKTDKENKATRMKSFLSVLNKSEDMLNSWNERIWMLMVEKAIVQRDKSVKFIFHGNI